MRTYSIASLIPSFRSAARRCVTTAFLTLLAVGSADAQRRPTINSFTPVRGPTTTMVTITGTNFNRDVNGNIWSGTAPYAVQVGASGEARPTVVSNTTMRVAVPASASSGPIRIRAFGSSTRVISQSSSNFTLTQVTRPSITSFSPASGPVGTQITITGTNFHRDSVGNIWTGSIPYRVEFYNLGVVIPVVPTFVSNTRLRVTVPAGVGNGQSPLRLQQNGVTFNASNATFTMTAPSTLRLTNNTQYNVVSLTLNGQQKFAPGYGVASNRTENLQVSPGTYSMVAGLGFVNSNGARDIWFTFTRTVTITSGQTNSQIFSRITVGQLLTMGTNTSTWIGTFFDNNGRMNQAKFVFSSNGGWQFFVNGVANGSGSLSEVSWANSSPNVTFRINNTLPNITISYPFGSFFFRNGPPSWPLIQYVKQ